MRATLVAARAAVARRRLQTLILTAVVLLTAATSVIALGLLAVSHAPFDQAFARAAGAHLTVEATAGVPVANLSAPVAGATAVAGPFPMVTAAGRSTGGPPLPRLTLVGRADAGRDVDRLSVSAGHWLTGPGQVVLSGAYAGYGDVGTRLTLDLPGNPTVTVVGVADSATDSADGWLWPGDSALLAHPTGQQLLYRFQKAATGSDVAADLAAVKRALPPDAVTGSTNWLTTRVAANRSVSAFVPFVVVFAVLGLVMSVLITANVVNGAVVAGFRTIGVLKTLGFTPAQVVGVYLARVLVPAVLGGLAGVAAGVALAAPLLARTQRAYQLPENVGGVPDRVVVLVAVAAPALVALAALGPAWRAGRLAANEAIAVGRAPRAGRGFRVRRALAATRLPRAVAFGLGAPMARPTRAAGTVVAVALGATTLVFAVGLTASLDRVHADFTRVGAVPIGVEVADRVGPGKFVVGPGDPSRSAVDVSAVRATVADFPGTAHIVGEVDIEVHAAGVTKAVTVETYSGDASWTGFAMVSGRWYAAPAEVVASSYLLRQTGHRVGDTLTLTGDAGTHAVTIVGSFMDGRDDYDLVADATTMTSVVAATAPDRFEVGLRAGVDPHAYASSLQDKFGPGSATFVDDRVQGESNQTFVVLDALIGTLTVLLCVVAALGVVNTVVLNTQERVHEIGVLKSIGMTPGALRAMVVSSMVGIGLIGGLIAVPGGVALQHWIVPVMGAAAGTDVPGAVVAVYGGVELLLLGLAAVGLAVGAALLPAGWASRITAAHALRAE